MPIPFRPLAAAAGLLFALGGAAAHDAHDHAKHLKESAARPGAVTVRGLDVALVDQHGRERNVQRDVVGQRIVVVDFVYTSCTTVCPLASAMFADLQRRLGPALGKDVELVTITVDPVRDTPQVLKAYAAKFEAREGWTWLTGKSVAVNEVLKGLGAFSADFTQHPLMVLVGDGASGQWTRFAGTPEPQRLADHVARLQAARAGQAIAKSGG